MLVISTIITLLAGYLIGLLQGGIHIYRDARSKQKSKDESHYNRDYSAELPPEIKHYYDQHNGMTKF